MIEHLQEILSSVDVGEVSFCEPMSRHTTWRIGGLADAFVVPGEISHLVTLASVLAEHSLPWFVIGRGSNLLVRDGGFRGVVVKLADNFSQVRFLDQGIVEAWSGKSYVSLAKETIKRGLTGLEFATGIPGTVGGAVMMNAGAHGSETQESLVSADIVTAEGRIQTLTREDLRFGYRYSVLKDHPRMVLSARFQLSPGDPDQMSQLTRAWTKKRTSTQPLQLPSCGSVFRNPDGNYAAKLIEEAGLKGFRVGGAQISELHANFIVNLGNASAIDVLSLIERVQETVQSTFDIALHTEVRIIGEETAASE
ncbi:MAG: UDP-N-acetylenolpyruvoylglucosamine reductase [Bacilli bacterium]|nr:UDP-N-acetylenolpyruvoylglucosamine reductase [Bacilli bacterium]